MTSEMGTEKTEVSCAGCSRIGVIDSGGKTRDDKPRYWSTTGRKIYCPKCSDKLAAPPVAEREP